MINQKESKQVTMDSLLLKLLSRDMKTKKAKINRQTIKKKKKKKLKNNRRIKAMGYITRTMDHNPRNG